jgi:hypothetical protein
LNLNLPKILINAEDVDLIRYVIGK